MRRKLLMVMVSFSLVLALATMPFMAACAPEEPTPPPPALPEKEVFIPLNIGTTGPVASACIPGANGYSDAIAYYNQIEYIKGVKLVGEVFDNKYQLPETVSIYERVKARNPLAWVYFGASGGNEALKARYEEDKIPSITCSVSDPQFFPPGWIYADGPAVGDTHLAFYTWFKSTYKGDGPIRIGWIGWDSPYGRSGHDELKEYVAQFGDEVLDIEFTTFAPTTTKPILVRLMDAGATYVAMNLYNTTVDVILRDAKEMGADLKFVGQAHMCPDDQIMLSGPEIAEGYIADAKLYSTMEPEDQLPKKFLDLLPKMRKDYLLNEHYMMGWNLVLITAEAIRLAVEEVGVEGLTGEAVNKYGFQRMHNFDSPVSGSKWGLRTPDERSLFPYARFCQVQGGKVIQLTDWLETQSLRKLVAE